LQKRPGRPPLFLENYSAVDQWFLFAFSARVESKQLAGARGEEENVVVEQR
jgi:hypothetical protein